MNGTRAGSGRLPSGDGLAPVAAQNRGRLHQELSAADSLRPGGSQDQVIGGPPARSWSSAPEDEQLLAEDEELEIATGSGAAAKDEEIDQQAKEGTEEGQQHGRAE